MFLQVMAYSRYIGTDFDPVRQPNPCNLAQGRGGRLGSRRLDLRAYSLPLRAALQSRRLDLLSLV